MAGGCLSPTKGSPTTPTRIDPEGSVSIIDMRRGALGAEAERRTHRGLRKFNDAALDPSVRIFGPGASVAQDIEPEYIAVSHDSQTAYVTSQENNALAIIDIASANVTRLVGLGFKDHSAVEAKTQKSTTFDPSSNALDRETAAGQKLFLGGFSGLHFEGIDPKTGRYKFITHTDRGPNAEPTGIEPSFPSARLYSAAGAVRAGSQDG